MYCTVHSIRLFAAADDDDDEEEVRTQEDDDNADMTLCR